MKHEGLISNISSRPNAEEGLVDDIIDLEEFAKEGRRPPRARGYRVRIDRERYIIKTLSMTGRELLILAGKTPATAFMFSLRLRGGETRRIGLNETVDFTTPGVEAFTTAEISHAEL